MVTSIHRLKAHVRWPCAREPPWPASNARTPGWDPWDPSDCWIARSMAKLSLTDHIRLPHVHRCFTDVSHIFTPVRTRLMDGSVSVSRMASSEVAFEFSYENHSRPSFHSNTCHFLNQYHGYHFHAFSHQQVAKVLLKMYSYRCWKWPIHNTIPHLNITRHHCCESVVHCFNYFGTANRWSVLIVWLFWSKPMVIAWSHYRHIIDIDWIW